MSTLTVSPANLAAKAEAKKSAKVAARAAVREQAAVAARRGDWRRAQHLFAKANSMR